MRRQAIGMLAMTLFTTLCSGGCNHSGTSLASVSEVNQQTLDVIPKEWLKNQITVEQAEEKNLVSDQQLGPKPIPFGFINREWEEFKSQLRPEDELWEFRSDDKSWEMLAGRAGICIVRHGRIVAAIVTLMN